MLIEPTLLLLGFSSLALANPTTQPNSQHPILQPNDNFNLTPVRDALISNKIIGDVLDDFEPKYYLDVVYAKHDTRVMLGTEIKPKHVKKRPRFDIQLIPNADPGKAPEGLTLVLTDPDATSRYDPKWSEMCHWIVTNFTHINSEIWSGSDEIDTSNTADDETHPNTRDAGDLDHHHNRPKENSKYAKHNKDHKLPGELESYFAPSPPPKTGWHRYVFVLLEGDTTNLTPPRERRHWGYGKVRHGVRDWAAENGLEVVGANFFFAMNEKQ